MTGRSKTSPNIAPLDFWLSRARRKAVGGFTLAEMLVSVATSAIVLGILVFSAMSLRRGVHSNEVYAGAYADQRRLTDYVGRDLRRAVSVAVTDEAGVRTELGKEPFTVTISERASLILKLPGFYRSRTGPDDEPLEVVGSEEALGYGGASGVAAPVEVQFRKIFYANENCVCFVRQEEGQDEVIVKHAENLSVQVSIAADGQSSGVQTWFHSTELGPAPLVKTYDQMLLRNPPLDYRP